MLNIRLLPPDEYDKLPIPVDPASSLVAVLEDPETLEIKGYWAAQNAVHLEPIWLSEDVRGGINAIRMYASLLAGLNSFGVKNFYCFADREEISDYLTRLGLHLKPYVIFEGTVPEVPQHELKEN